MKAIILAAGSGTRLEPLTSIRPKPLIDVVGKPFLSYLLENVHKAGIKEIGVVVGYKKERMIGFLKNYKNITVIEQNEQLGTGDAVLKAKDFAGSEDFLVMYGDNLYDAADIKALTKTKGNAIVGLEHPKPRRYAVLLAENGHLKKIVEKPNKHIGNLINAGLYKFTPDVFKSLKGLKKSKRNEYELTDAVSALITNGVKVFKAQGRWFDVGYPWHLLELNEHILSHAKNRVEGNISEKAEIEGRIIVGKNTKIKAGANIEGPVYIGSNCEVGPNCLIRAHTSIGDNCKIGASVEIKNSIIMNHTNVPHHNYIGDSIIGENCNIGAGTKIANLRHDNQSVKISCKGLKVDSERRKFGAIIGDNVKIGINCSIMPGVKIGTNCLVGPHLVLYKDLEPNKAIYVEQNYKFIDLT